MNFILIYNAPKDTKKWSCVKAPYPDKRFHPPPFRSAEAAVSLAVIQKYLR
jgi:hypothetical protein